MKINLMQIDSHGILETIIATIDMVVVAVRFPKINRVIVGSEAGVPKIN